MKPLHDHTEFHRLCPKCKRHTLTVRTLIQDGGGSADLQTITEQCTNAGCGHRDEIRGPSTDYTY